MKKIVLLITLMLAITMTGCSCSKETYEFHSITISDEGEKTYTCSKSDKSDPNVKYMCDNLSDMSIQLKDKNTMIVNIHSFNMKDEEAEYKKENGYLYMKTDGEWMKFAECRKDMLIIEMTGVKVTLKK